MTGLKLLADRVDAKLLSRATAGAAVVTFAAPGLPGSRVCPHRGIGAISAVPLAVLNF
jgi:hypothetical protein